MGDWFFLRCMKMVKSSSNAYRDFAYRLPSSSLSITICTFVTKSENEDLLIKLKIYVIFRCFGLTHLGQTCDILA